jgi:rubrerythrin
VFIWRETAQERVARLKTAGVDTIVCSVCGYNMTGLKEARCPECGVQYTLDQLYASQPSRDNVALEEE